MDNTTGYIDEQNDDVIPTFALGSNSGTQNEDGVEDRGDDYSPDAELQQDSEDAQQRHDNKSEFVPKSRFNEVNNEKKAYKERAELADVFERENRELRARLEALDAERQAQQDPVKQQAAITADIKELNQRYHEVFAEGDMDAAVEIQSQIQQALIAQQQAAILQAIRQEQVDKVEHHSLMSVINQAYELYPHLNPESPDYSQTQVDKINRLHEAYKRDGLSPAQALSAAMDDFMMTLNLSGSNQNTSQQMKSAAVQRNVAAMQAQPPAMTAVGVGNRAAAARMDISKMTEAEFASLPDAEKKRLRGD